MRTAEAAHYLGVAESSLEKDRVTRALGIPYLKIGRSVLYDIGDLDAYMAARRRLSTSDTGKEAR